MAFAILGDVAASMVANEKRRREFGDNLPFLRCMVCDRHVRDFEFVFDEMAQEWDVTVKCHGDVETTSISRHLVHEGELIEARCFDRPQIEAAE